MRVAVLGAGVMGRNIGRTFLRGDADVALFSRSEATLRDARGALAGERLDALETATSVEAAARGADLVIESVPERLALKLPLLERAEAVAAEDAVIATNTSSLPLEQLAGALRRPERFLGLHWFNPAHLVPLVEVVPAPASAPEVVRWSSRTLERMGKRPLVLRQALPGFIANRLQYALIREALQLIEDGVVDPAGIDAALTECLGPRWAVIGPMRSTDLAGVETAIAVAEQLFPQLSAAREPQRPLRDLRDEGRLGVGTGEGFHRYPDPEAAIAERDRGLEAVLAAQAVGRTEPPRARGGSARPATA